MKAEISLLFSNGLKVVIIVHYSSFSDATRSDCHQLEMRTATEVGLY